MLEDETVGAARRQARGREIPADTAGSDLASSRDRLDGLVGAIAIVPPLASVRRIRGTDDHPEQKGPRSMAKNIVVYHQPG